MYSIYRRKKKTIKVGEYKDYGGSIFDINFEIRFLDSFKFLQTSLANLVSNLSPNMHLSPIQNY